MKLSLYSVEASKVAAKSHGKEHLKSYRRKVVCDLICWGSVSRMGSRITGKKTEKPLVVIAIVRDSLIVHFVQNFQQCVIQN